MSDVHNPETEKVTMTIREKRLERTLRALIQAVAQHGHLGLRSSELNAAVKEATMVLAETATVTITRQATCPACSGTMQEKREGWFVCTDEACAQVVQL